jgi:hypothetical protein
MASPAPIISSARLGSPSGGIVAMLFQHHLCGREGIEIEDHRGGT